MDVDLGHLEEPRVCDEDDKLGVQAVYIEAGAVSKLMDILENFQNPVFICDSNTRAAAESFLEEEFKDYPVIELNPRGLQSDSHGMDKVMTQLDYCDRGLSSVSVDVLVAIGGGTIHDLTRYAAVQYDIPFVSIPTAASVDGYSTAHICMTEDGAHWTVPGVSPRWILADTEIFARAPKQLTAAGIANLWANDASSAEWRQSHLQDGSDMGEKLCDMLEHAYKDVDREMDDIRDGDWDAMEKLMYALILSGIARQVAGAIEKNK